MTAPLNSPRTPPYKLAGTVLALIAVAVLVFVFLQFRGDLLPRTQLTMLAARSGLSLNEGSKVTLNGVQIGRVTGTEVMSVGGEPQAKILLEVNPKYLEMIPKNVDASIDATTVFGNKYVNFTSPKNPSPERLTKDDVIDVTSVTTEFNTLFETIVDVAKQVDPIKLNQTLTATAEALDGLGDRFGESFIDGNEILTDVNARMPELRRDNRLLADLVEVYADASPDLFDALENAVTTAQTLNEQRGDLDQALVASVGFGNTGADVFERSGPYLVRALEDLIPTSETLDEYSPALFCTIRNFHDVEPRFAAALGGDGYSLQTLSAIEGAGNPYVYPDNLPRVNARGGPEGRPGCWQPITRDLFPAPYLVADTGASIAPYNHFELGQPLLIEYVWGRQVGENTINP